PHSRSFRQSRAGGARPGWFDGMGESRRTNRTGRGTRRRRTEGSIMAEATAWSAGLRASVVRLGNSGAQLVGRLWDDAQTLARDRRLRVRAREGSVSQAPRALTSEFN